jgi:hypothetical protein
VRDIRGGAGERQTFRNILKWLEVNASEVIPMIIPKVPELGRWDDLLGFQSTWAKKIAYDMIWKALKAGDGLCAKWMPRQKGVAQELRNHMGMSPKQYRKTLVGLTNVVESQMCSGQWGDINFSQVPSVASARYKKAFNRHTSKYQEYVNRLVAGDSGVKVNANAIFPHDVLKGLVGSYLPSGYGETELQLVQKQWEALPNYVGDSSILPMVDVSGSMTCSAGGNTNVTCMEVAVSLGLYLADKNRGVFHDAFLTFSSKPSLVTLRGGNIIEKVQKMVRSNWNMSTNLEGAFNRILEVAVNNQVPNENMPKTLIIFSDMQFNRCIDGRNDSALEMIRKKYGAAGYQVPNVIFWNLNAHNNVPVAFDTTGAALVSGFSPALLKSILGNSLEDFTPRNIMLQTIMDDRYKFI